MSEGRSTSALSGSGASAVSGGGGGGSGSTTGSQARSSSAISSAQAAAEAEEARLLEKEERARLQQLQRAAGAYSALEAKAGAARRVDGGSTAHARYLMGVAHSTGTAVQRRPKAFAPQQLAFDFASETPFQQHHGRSESAHQFSNAMYGADGARQERYWAAAPDFGVGRALAPVSGTGPWAGRKEPEELVRLPGDEARAAGLYQAAAEDGDAAAQYNLGLSCFTGTGVAKDAHRAARCYLAAANQGHAEAQDALASCHRYCCILPRTCPSCTASATNLLRGAASQSVITSVFDMMWSVVVSAWLVAERRG
jgi:TPR repeat protein